MPIYEYACETCSHEFEKLVRIDAPRPPCPECGAEVRKRVSASGFILKGGGWYKDHYGLKKSGSAKSEGDSSTAKSTDTSTTKKDSGSAGTSPAPKKAATTSGGT